MKRKSKRGEKGFKEHYLASLQYIKESKKFIYAIMGIFVFFALLGFFIPVSEILSEKIINMLKGILEKTQGMSQFELTKFIFLNNIQSSFMGMALGIIFGVFSVAMAISNGFILGFVAALSVKEAGVLILWRILPHGIFELPAIFISLGLGLRLGTSLFQKGDAFKLTLFNSIRSFVLIVLPLLIVAAIIEGGLISLMS